MQACIGMLILLLVLTFLNDFEIIKLEAYMSLSELLLSLVLLSVMYISCSLILRDAYFGVVSGNQMKVCLSVFTILALALDVFTLLDVVRGEECTIVSICSVFMSNTIMLSLWYKRKSW